MVMTKINGRYNLIAKDMEPKEFTEELSSLIQTMADDLDNDEDIQVLISTRLTSI